MGNLYRTIIDEETSMQTIEGAFDAESFQGRGPKSFLPLWQ